MVERRSWLRPALIALVLFGVAATHAADLSGRWRGTMVFLPPKGFQVDESLKAYQDAVGRMEAILSLRKNRTFLMTIRPRAGLPAPVGKPNRVSMNPGTLSGNWSLKAGILKLTMTKRNGKKPNGPSVFDFRVSPGGAELVQIATSGMQTTFVR